MSGLFDGITAMRAGGMTPALSREREEADTPTMLRVSIVQQAVARAVKPLLERLNGIEENYIALSEGLEELESESVPGLKKQVTKLDEHLANAQRLATKRMDGFVDHIERIDTLDEAHGVALDQIRTLRRDVDALEADMKDAHKIIATTAPQGDVAALALRIIAAERGLTA